MKLVVEIDSLRNFSSNVDNGLSNLNNILSDMKKLTEDFKNTGNSKTLSLFDEFMNSELETKKNAIAAQKDSYKVLFTQNIIPKYEELYQNTFESVGSR